MKPGLLSLAAAKSKGDAVTPLPKPEPVAAEAGGSEEELARLAVQAIKDGDEQGAVDALLAAIRACVAKEDADEYPPAA